MTFYFKICIRNYCYYFLHFRFVLNFSPSSVFFRSIFIYFFFVCVTSFECGRLLFSFGILLRNGLIEFFREITSRENRNNNLQKKQLRLRNDSFVKNQTSFSRENSWYNYEYDDYSIVILFMSYRF